jgi:transcriptional antiterminator RfaH
MLAWYLVYTKPQQERLALENLERQGYQAYLPLIRNRRRRAGRYVALIEPMFPRYLFLHLSDVTDNWGPIRSTIGVSKMVRFGDMPARVPDDLIEILHSREDEAGVQDLAPPEFKAGDRIRIVEGPMAGYEGIYQAKTSQERVVILLEIVGQSSRVQLAAGHIEPASS